MPNISVTNIPTILKQNPYETQWELLESKVEKKHPFFGNVFTEHGCKYEDTALMLYSKLTNNEYKSQINFKHKDYTWISGRVDAITTNNCLVEIKCPYRKKFKDLLTEDDVPKHYWIQCQVYMEMCNIEICHYVEFFIEPNSPTDGSVGQISYVPICRNRKWWSENIEKIVKFYEEMNYWIEKKSLDTHPIRVTENEWSAKI